MLNELGQIFATSLKIWKLVPQRDKIDLILASLIILICGGLTSIPALALGRLLDQMVINPRNPTIFDLAFPYVLTIILAIIIREVLQVWRKYLVENVATQIEKQQIIRLFSQVLRLDLLSTDSKQSTGSLHGLIHRSVEGFVKLVKLFFLDFSPMAVAAVFALCVALYQQPKLGLVMSVVVPMGFGIILRQIISQKGIRVELLDTKKEIDGKAIELLSGRSYIRVANTEDYEIAKIGMVAEALRSKEIKHHISMARFDAVKYLNEGFFYVLVLCFSLFLMSQRNLSNGGVLTFSLLFASVLTPLRELHRILDEAHESHLRVNEMFVLMEQPEDTSFSLSTSQTAELSVQPGVPLIEAYNLCFRYPNSSDDDVKLDGITFSISSGEKIGITGESGPGKSTLIKLLLRVLHADSGVLRIMGRNIDSVTREEIGKKFGYVSQEPFVFSGTVRENLCYGVLDHSTDEQIIQSAKKARIHDDIMRMTGGYEAIVDERGGNLSGGQRQRVALARIFLKDPEIIVLDEATSALDAENERLVQDALTTLMEGRNVITIAHRLSTLRQTDKILVFENGKIVESGTYDGLEKGSGVFAKLIRAGS